MATDKPDTRSPAPPATTKQQNFKLPVELMERLRAYADKAKPRASLLAHVELAIEQYLERHED